VSSNNASIRDNIASKFGKVNLPNRMQKEPLNVTTVKKVLSPIPPHLSKKILEKSKIHQYILVSKDKDTPFLLLSYAQAVMNIVMRAPERKEFPMHLNI